MDKKNVAIISNTRNGTKINLETAEKLNQDSFVCRSFASPRFAEEFKIDSVGEDLAAWMEEEWTQQEIFIFLTTTGFAVRAIAPCINKESETTIVVLDESCQYIIPLLSTRMGMASSVAGIVAQHVGAIPVFTTSAAMMEGSFPIEQFLIENGLDIPDKRLLRQIAAGVAGGQTVGLYCDSPIEGSMPKELTHCETIKELENYRFGIAITQTENELDIKNKHAVLHLIPRSMVVGISYKNNMSMPHLKEQITDILQSKHIATHGIEKLVSIDTKKEDSGIIALAKNLNVAYVTYTKEELAAVNPVSKESIFHPKTDAISLVCERAAILGSGGGMLIVPTLINTGVHIAVTKRNWKLVFKDPEFYKS